MTIMIHCLRLLWMFFWMVYGCQGQDAPAKQMVVLRNVPNDGKIHLPFNLVIRNNFEGSVKYVESDEFQIHVNISAANTDELAKVQYNYTNYGGSVLLQVYENVAFLPTSPVRYMVLLIGGATLLIFLFMIVFVCWWNVYCRPFVKETLLFNPDSSEAPLLDDKGSGHSQNGGHKLRKKKRRRQSHPPGSEDMASSEEDTLDRGPSDHRSPNKLNATAPPYQSNTLGRPAPQTVIDSDLVATVRQSPAKTLDHPDGTQTLPHPHAMHDASGKPVVSYIKIQGDQQDTKNRGKKTPGQYVALNQSEGSGGSDAEKMNPAYDYHTMPDVVRSRNRPVPPERATTQPQDRLYRTNSGRYVRLTNSEVDSSDNEFLSNTMPASLVGAQTVVPTNKPVGVAQLLADGQGKSSPKFSHNTDRIPTTFCQPPGMPPGMPRHERHGVDIDLDSVGSSRSGGSSSMTSGIKTQSGSVTDSDRRTMSDSDSASVSSVPTKPVGILKDTGYNPRQYIQPSAMNNRLVDEAYGTMGSNNGHTNGTGTMRSHSSTASNGSGSSGSVVTIIAASDNNGTDMTGTFGRRRQRKGYESSGSESGTLERPGTGGTSTFTGGPTKYVHMSIITSLCCLCIFTGVYSQLLDATTVHITVFLPPGYIKNGSEVHFSTKKYSVLDTTQMKYPLNILRYDAENAHIMDPNSKLCDSNSDRKCGGACDVNTGACMCSQGLALHNNDCVDVDECLDSPCDKHADCFDLHAMAQCICSDGFYGDGKTCYACEEPCKNNTFEAMPCVGSNPKICKECSGACTNEHYVSSPCTPRQNIECTQCTPRCQRDKFEFSPCVGKHNRQCRDTTILTPPHMSNNLIFEDRKTVKKVLSYVLHQTEGSPPLTHALSMNRASGFSVRIVLKESNLAPLFKAVDHRASNDNDGFHGDLTITERYCPHPVPEKYQLSMEMHRGVTSQAEYHHCNKKKRSSTACTGQTGYYLNPSQPCETYSQFGRLPTLNLQGWNVVCTKPGVLSDAFDVSSDLSDLSTMFVDKTVRCAEQRTNCDSCQTMCARNMQNRQGSHRCNVTSEEADNGESPRLSHCLSCCGKQDCAQMCEVYHDQQCEPLRCVTGNLAEFVLKPVFAHRGQVFGCNVAPKPDYTIYDIEYTVLYNDEVINQKTLHATRRYDGSHPDKAIGYHNFLKVYYCSEVTRDVTFIEGDASQGTFNAGHYTDSGRVLSEADITEETLSVRPKKPFAVNSHMWSSEDCDTDALSKLLIADPSSHSDPYIPDPQLVVRHVQRGEYRVSNRTNVPFIYFEVPENVSVLEPLYEDTTVREDTTLKADLQRKNNMWKLNIQGELMRCPGFLSVKVFDIGYLDHPLYYYDVGVQCPKQFNLNFTLPTEGADDYDKRYKVDIRDSHRTIHMTVFRPAPNMTKETYEHKQEPSMTYEDKGESTMTIFTPVVAVLCVVVCFLAILLIIGFVTESAKPHRSTENKVHSQHLMFVVCYVTFRAAYSLAVTFTVLLLLIRFVNRESVGTMLQFHRFVDTANNIQKIEVEKIQTYVMSELQRQNQLANQTKVLCEDKLLALQAVLEETKMLLRVDDGEERLISDMVLQYTRLMIMNLTNDINKFKSEFTLYSRQAMDQLMRNIVQTSSALQSNKWLAGAKVIYDVVESKRSRGGRTTKPFMEWVGIKQEVERLSIDLSLRDFPMPNLTAYFALDIPAMDHRQSELPSIDDISLPRNQWYYQYENNKPSVGIHANGNSGNKKQSALSSKHMMSYNSLLAILILVDVIWFIHRMAKTYSTAKMILYGCPYYIDCKKESRGQQHKMQNYSVSSRCLQFMKDLNIRIMKTEFIPKLVAAVTTCCALYLALRVADHMMTVKTLASVGYFDSLVAPVQTSYSLARTRIKTNAYRINKFEYPFYEELVNIRTKRYQLMLEMYRDLQRTNHMLHDSEYCAWVKMLNPNAQCNCTTADQRKLTFDGCDLPPVSPLPYTQKDFSDQKERLIVDMMPYMNAGRQLVMDSAHLMVIFVALLVLVDVLGSVTWIYLKRFNLLRLKALFEIEQYPDTG